MYYKPAPPFPYGVALTALTGARSRPLFAYAAPLAGLFWLAVALRVFEREMRHYQSSGH